MKQKLQLIRKPWGLDLLSRIYPTETHREILCRLERQKKFRKLQKDKCRYLYRLSLEVEEEILNGIPDKKDSNP